MRQRNGSPAVRSPLARWPTFGWLSFGNLDTTVPPPPESSAVFTSNPVLVDMDEWIVAGGQTIITITRAPEFTAPVAAGGITSITITG